jgi:hypothetical protein
MDLEEAVTRSWKPHQPADGDSPSQWHQIRPPTDKRLTLTGLTPDGRCFLYTSHNGDVFYYHIERPHEPHLLMSAPLDSPPRSVATRLTFDYLGMQAEVSPTTLFPTSFNMAITRRVHLEDSTMFTLVEIWQVAPILQAGLVQGYSCKQLASFYEEGKCSVQTCSLQGSHFAYASANSLLVTVVDWTKLPTKSTTYPRVYIRGKAEVCKAGGRYQSCLTHHFHSQRLVLLPDQRILIHEHSRLYLKDWGRECPVSSLVASEADLDIPRISRSSWRRESTTRIPMRRELLPFVLDASIRFILPTWDGPVGLSISQRQAEGGVNPSEVTLVADSFRGSDMLQSYTCQRGVAMSCEGPSRMLQYSWPKGDSVQGLTVTNIRSGECNTKAVYLNDALNCVHIFDSTNLMYMTVRL